MRVLARKLASFVWPPNASLYSSSTCVHLRLLAGSFDQGFIITLLRNVMLTVPRELGLPVVSMVTDDLALWSNDSDDPEDNV